MTCKSTLPRKGFWVGRKPLKAIIVLIDRRHWRKLARTYTSDPTNRRRRIFTAITVDFCCFPSTEHSVQCSVPLCILRILLSNEKIVFGHDFVKKMTKCARAKFVVCVTTRFVLQHCIRRCCATELKCLVYYTDCFDIASRFTRNTNMNVV